MITYTIDPDQEIKLDENDTEIIKTIINTNNFKTTLGNLKDELANLNNEISILTTEKDLIEQNIQDILAEINK